jgi:formate dehydrogenase alpha subunit
LIVVDPRQTELSRFADIWLSVKPRTDLELINGLAALLCEKEAYDPKFIDRYTEGFSLFRYGLSSLNLDRISQLTGLTTNDISSTAAMLKGKKIAMVIGHGVLQQNNGMHTLGAICNLSLISGSFGKRGAGLYILSKENNQAGAMDMGTSPDLLPGRQSLVEDTVRKKWEKNWKTSLSPDAGLNMVRMIEAAETGRLKALYIMGENPLRALPQKQRVKNALQKLDFLVVQDIINTETAEMADVVLPGAALCEKMGSITNLEGRIQTFDPVVNPPGKARADWEILDLLAARLGNNSPFESVEKIRKEIRNLVPMYAGLNGKKESWIETVSAKAIFNSKADAELMTFYPVVSTEEKSTDPDYPFTAIVGTQRFQLGGGTRTSASNRIRTFAIAGKLEISPGDAAALKIIDDDLVVIRSPHGSITRNVRITSDLNRGQLFIPTGVDRNQAMDLFSLSDLNRPGASGWKTCEVKIEKA